MASARFWNHPDRQITNGIRAAVGFHSASELRRLTADGQVFGKAEAVITTAAIMIAQHPVCIALRSCWLKIHLPFAG